VTIRTPLKHYSPLSGNSVCKHQEDGNVLLVFQLRLTPKKGLRLRRQQVVQRLQLLGLRKGIVERHDILLTK